MSSYSIRGGTYEGAHLGDTIYQFYSDGRLVDDDYELDTYVERAREELAAQAARYVPLDLDPMVVTVDRELRAVECPQTPLVEAFLLRRHMVILGSAGSGKSSSLRHLVCAGDGELRILVELARFRRLANVSDVQALLMLVGEQVMALSRKDSAPSLRLLHSLLEREPVTLLFDGLNEVEASIRPACLQAIDDLRARFGCRIVLATRGHGFMPPDGWSVFRLRDLSDAQVVEYLHRNAPPRVTAIVERRLALGDNPLLRVPLFLKYVIELIAEDAQGGEPALAGSRVTIVARYVRFLCRRDDAKLNAVPIDADLLHEVLARLALKLQRVGQSLSRREAAGLLEDRFASAADANAVFDRIAARGLLIVDERHVRFWHHTIQELFFSNGCRQELFRDGEIRRRKARALFARLVDEDALTFAIAEASDDELLAMMRVAVAVNPRLALRWGDELGADARGARAVQALREWTRRTLRLTSWLSRVGYAKKLGRLSAVMLLVTSATLLAPVVLDHRNGVSLPTSVFVAIAIVALVLALAAAVVALYPGCELAEELAGAVHGVRHRPLREWLATEFRRVAQSRLSLPELVKIAETALTEPSATDDPLAMLERSTAPHLAIRVFRSSNDRRTPQALAALALSGRGNVYSLQALRTLGERARRDPGEADLAARAVTALLADDTIPVLARRRVAQTLAAVGRRPIKRPSLFQVALQLLFCTCGALALQALWWYAVLRPGMARGLNWFLLEWFVVGPSAVALGVFAHARWVGARPILGLVGVEAMPPRSSAVFTGVLVMVLSVGLPVLLYSMVAPLIKLNAAGPRFASARTIFAELEATEGDSIQ